MNYFIAVGILCAIVYVQALTPEQKDLARGYHAKCVAETGVDEELVIKGRKGEFVTDEKLRKYILCFLKDAGIVNDRGEPQADNIKKTLAGDATPAEIDAVLAKCRSNAKTPAEKAAAFYMCYWINSKKHITL